MSDTVDANAKCQRCGYSYAAHSVIGGTRGRCPDGRGCGFYQRATQRRVSQSFNDREIAVLDHVVRGMLTGADLRPFAKVRARDIGKLAGKVATMKRTSEARSRLRLLQGGAQDASVPAGEPTSDDKESA